MSIQLAAVRSGSDPLASLPAGAFPRTLEDPIYCPKCDATYNVIADYDASVNKFFADDTRRHLSLLRKAIFLDHALDHRTTHFETNGVTVTGHRPPPPPPDLTRLAPASKLIN